MCFDKTDVFCCLYRQAWWGKLRWSAFVPLSFCKWTQTCTTQEWNGDIQSKRIHSKQQNTWTKKHIDEFSPGHQEKQHVSSIEHRLTKGWHINYGQTQGTKIPVPISSPGTFFLLDAACVPRRSRVKPFSRRNERTNGQVPKASRTSGVSRWRAPYPSIILKSLGFETPLTRRESAKAFGAIDGRGIHNDNK